MESNDAIAPNKSHPDKPTFRVYVLKLCEHEIARIDEMARTLKKARKEYINIHNIAFMDKDTDGLRSDLVAYEKIVQGYDELDAKLYEIDAQLAKERAALKEQRDVEEVKEFKNDAPKN
jgi:hypothetical protein